MGKAVGPLLQIAGAFIGGPVGLVVSFIGSQISSDEAEREARRRAIKAYNASLQDRNVSFQSAILPWRYVLGTARLGGVTAYADTVGAQKEKLDEVVIVCTGPVSGVAGMWLGDTFLDTGDFASGAPTVGQYTSSNSKAFTDGINTNLVSTDHFTVAHIPRSAGDVHVSTYDGESNYSSLTVSSVSGTTVNLSTSMTGPVVGDYNWVTSQMPYQVQWVLGGRQQASTTWPGVTTPKWTSDHRLRGIAHFRSLCDWDENIFAQGKPRESLLIDGVMPHDPRHNLNPIYALAGALVGTPGTLPTDVTTAGITNGLAREITGIGTEDGIPYFEIRIFGTTTAASQVQIKLPQFSACPAASPGQAWNARAHLRVVGGSLTQFTSSFFALIGYDAGGAGTAEAATALSTTTAALPLRDAAVEVSDPSAASGVTKMGAYFRFNYASGAVVNITMRIGLPQLWRTADPVQWTSNPAILAGWFMTLPLSEAGCGIPFEWVDWSTIVTAANICDELVTVRHLDGTGYEDIKRYECHTVLSADAAPLDNLAVILGAMAGYRAFTAGQYRVFAGAHRTPTVTLTDADVEKGSIRIEPHSSAFDNAPNVMNGRIVDRNRGYIETGVTPVVNDYYIGLDGGEESDEFELPASTDARQAQYLLGVELEHRRPRKACQITALGKGKNIALGDGVVLDLDGFEDFDAFTWEVVGRGNPFKGSYQLMLEQTRSTDWALDPDRFTPVDQPTPPDNSYLFNVDEPAGFSAIEGTPTVLSDGTILTNVNCTWTLHSQEYVRQSGAIEIRWRSLDVDTWSGPMTLEGDETSARISIGAVGKARYAFQARARNGLPAWSEWVQDYADVDGRLGRALRVVSTGASDTASPDAAGLYDPVKGTTIYGASRSFNVARVRRAAPYDITYHAAFDIYAGGSAITSMTSALNATDADSILVVWTDDDPRVNRLSASLAAAMYRCGASRGVYGSPEFMHGAAYILVAIGGCGEGNGAEFYQGAVDNDTDAWCDLTFLLGPAGLVVSGATAKPRTLRDLSYTGDYDASASTILVPRTNCKVNGSTITKDGGSALWDSDCFSNDGFTGGAFASGVPQQDDKALMFGLNSDPLTNQSYTNIDWAWYPRADGLLYIYEGGTSRGSVGTYAAGDVLAVIYDGYSIIYTQNGEVQRTVPKQAQDLKLFFDSSFHDDGATLANCQFGPMSGVNGIGTNQLVDEAVDEVIVNTQDLHTGTAPGGGGGIDILDCYTLYTNSSDGDATVDIQASWSATVHGAGTGSSSVEAYINVILRDAGGTGVGVLGELNPEAPVPDVSSGETVRYTAARTFSAIVPPTYKVEVTINNALTNHGNNGGSTVTLRDGWVKLIAILK